MRIAVVENREGIDLIRNVVEKRKSNRDWQIDYYNAGSQLLTKKKVPYDVILVDHDLPDCTGKRLLDILSSAVEAETVLIGSFDGDSNKEDIVFDNKINAIIDKKNLGELIDWLSYADAKVRLKKVVKRESGIYSEIISNTNGCVYNVDKDVTVLGISRLLTNDRIEVITRSIESTNNRVVLYFTDEVNSISSSFLGLLATFWDKIVKEKNGIMAFWVKSNRPAFKSMIEDFSMTNLFPCFDHLDDALNYVRKAYQSKKRDENEYIEKDDTERIKIVSCYQ